MSSTKLTRLKAWFAARPSAPLVIAAGVLAVVLAGSSVAIGVLTVPRQPEIADEVAEVPGPRAVPETTAAAMRARTCVVDAGDPAFATLGASVIDVASGEVLYSRASADQAPSLSVHKIVTAALALEVLGPDTRIPTRVYEGSVKGTIVLVGGGDATLSALPEGTESVYSGAPRLSDLAAQTKESLDKLYPGSRSWPSPGGPPDGEDDEGEEPDDEDAGDDDGRRGRTPPRFFAPPTPDWEITQVVVDAGRWTADAWNPNWPADARASGAQAMITPLMVDGDRNDPTVVSSARGDNPVVRATSAFIKALELPADTAVTQGSAITDRPLLAEVHSQPVSVLVSQMLLLNDNTLAEMLARLMSTSIGYNGSIESLDQMYRSTLAGLGLPEDGLTANDGGGLSESSVASPALVARLLALVAQGEAALGPLAAALPVAGESGTLQHRFSGEFAVVKGAFAGTGTSGETAATLAGILTAADGTVLAVALQSTDGVTSATGVALESLVVAIHGCGGNLSNSEPVAAN